MDSHISPNFRRCYRSLPKQVRRLAWKNYKLWRDNHRHPGLRFKLIDRKARRYSARVGDNYRVLGKRLDDGMLWYWIGTHEEYNRLI